MAQGKMIVTIAVVVIISGFLQVLLVFADCKDTPSRTALGFTKAYYQLDPSMAKFLCKKIAADEDADPVGDYLHSAAQEARAMGYSAGAMKSTLYHIETETVKKDDTTAEVRITGERKYAANPVFAWVAKLFFLGKKYAVDQTISVVKEDGRWKVCGQPFSPSV